MPVNLSDNRTQNAIKRLESASFLPPIDFAHILLVADGTKPGMFTGIQTDLYESRADIVDFHSDECSCITDVCNALGLSYATRDDEVKVTTELGIRYGNRRLYFIGPNRDTAQRLMSTHTAGDDLQLGRLLGFPESAIKSYINDTCMKVASLPSNSQDVSSDQMKLLNHMISIDGWEDEVRYLRVYAERLLAISPTIYRKCIS
ncbi:MAG: hypothetical protein EOO17_01520 [Chloroflexi bacterium]|nr:MAG: hypothetical protein EOO17_01520 [Chloroflexota bacterium]